jgi:uncharacterized protein YjiS (DUF1127 family)
MNTIRKMWKDYRFHRLANRDSRQLRMHSDLELEDIGISRYNIDHVTHSKCGWCERWGSVGDGKGL